MPFIEEVGEFWLEFSPPAAIPVEDQGDLRTLEQYGKPEGATKQTIGRRVVLAPQR